MTKAKEEWGNIELPGLSDEELFTKNWNRVAANSEAAKTPEVQERNKKGQLKRKSSNWHLKLIGNKNAMGNINRLGMTNSEESNAKRSASMIGIERHNLRGVAKPKLACPHCDKVGGKPQMIQYHFDKCKFKPKD